MGSAGHRHHPRLAPLAAQLLGMDNPLSGLTWLSERRRTAAALLRGLANGEIPLTHEAFRTLQPWRAAAHLRELLMATSDYWKPPFYQLEAAGFDVWLVNARDVKHLPGRPKTDKLDAVWLCKVAERGMLRASFVPPEPARLLRDVTRYRVDLVGERGRALGD